MAKQNKKDFLTKEEKRELINMREVLRQAFITSAYSLKSYERNSDRDYDVHSDLISATANAANGIANITKTLAENRVYKKRNTLGKNTPM